MKIKINTLFVWQQWRKPTGNVSQVHALNFLINIKKVSQVLTMSPILIGLKYCYLNNLNIVTCFVIHSISARANTYTKTRNNRQWGKITKAKKHTPSKYIGLLVNV